MPRERNCAQPYSSPDASVCLATAMACYPPKERRGNRPCSAPTPMVVGGWLYDRANAEIVPSTPKPVERRNFVWPLTRPLPVEGQNA